MAVLNRFRVRCVYPNTNPENENELQLHIESPSDSESNHDEPMETLPRANRRRHRRRRLKRPKVATLDDIPVFSKHGGKRTLRRYQNRTNLHTWTEEDHESNVLDVCQSNKSPLTKLSEDPKALKHWNEFVEKSEEEQKIITGDLQLKSESQTMDPYYKTDKPFQRISSKIRRTLKFKKNLCIDTVRLFENEVIGFFKQSPKEKYVKYPNTSFDRLLMHAVAQYHCLYSFNKLEDTKRKVEVRNLKENWTPVTCFLHELISQSKS